MWTRLSAWHRRWNEELNEVLLNPELAEKIADPSRRRIAMRLTQLSAIERSQLHQFAITYQGAKKWKAAAKLTLLFSCVGVVLHILKPQIAWAVSLTVANVLGWAFVFSLTGIWFNYRRIVKRTFRTSMWAVVGVIGGLLGGTVVGTLINERPVWDAIVEDTPNVLKVAAIMGALYMVMIGLVARWRNQGYETINAQLELEAEREKSARQLSESQLRLLLAQIEPHFLFNTLGAVQQLSEQGAPHAAELTANLIIFLRASMSEMRAEKITLAEEFAMVKAYLEVMQVRMAQRLQFRLELPPQLESEMMPSMMLLTLAENAIKHGIEPALRGGMIVVSAQRQGSDLSIVVQDNGVGLSEKPSGGIGLQNVRDRLRLAYGANASLSISEAEQGGGVMAEIRLPINEQI